MWIEAIEGAAPSEDMAGLNDGDIRRIDARIAAASALQQDKLDSIANEVALLTPRGWKKALHLLREWSVLGVTATAIIALIGIVVALIIAVSNRREADAIFRTNINNFQERTGERLTRIEASLIALRAKAVVSNPADSENQTEAKSVLAAARKESIPLPLPVVEQGGRKFIEASTDDPKAWGVALGFISYRSSLNSAARPSVKFVPIPAGSTFHYSLMGAPGSTSKVELSNSTGVPIEQAARANLIGRDENDGLRVGPDFLSILGGSIGIDEYHFRNVVFTGVEIHYSGNPVILENVLFIDCVFVFDNNDHGRKLGQTLLASANVNFRAPA
jgi:hypothetical protein